MAAIWRHDALLEADAITRALEQGSWSQGVTDDPIGSMEIHVQGEDVVVLARFGGPERRWTMPAKPVPQDYALVQTWLEREVRKSGRVALAAEPPVQFAHVKLLMNAVVCAGQPALTFRVLR